MNYAIYYIITYKMFPLFQTGEPSLFKAHDHSAKKGSSWVQGQGSVWQVHFFPLLWWVEASYLCGTTCPPPQHFPCLISLPSSPKGHVHVGSGVPAGQPGDCPTQCLTCWRSPGLTGSECWEILAPPLILISSVGDAPLLRHHDEDCDTKIAYRISSRNFYLWKQF